MLPDPPTDELGENPASGDFQLRSHGRADFGHAAIAIVRLAHENREMEAAAGALVVRGASVEDCAAICAIYNQAIAERGSTFETEPRVAEDFHARIGTERFPLLVAEAGENVIGWAGLASYSERSCYAGIGECSVYVAPEARGRGVGTALAEALATETEGQGFHKLVGKLFTDNVASVRLCARCGFSEVGIHRRHGQLDGEWRDVLVVEWLLGPGACVGILTAKRSPTLPCS